MRLLTLPLLTLLLFGCGPVDETVSTEPVDGGTQTDSPHDANSGSNEGDGSGDQNDAGMDGGQNNGSDQEGSNTGGSNTGGSNTGGSNTDDGQQVFDTPGAVYVSAIKNAMLDQGAQTVNVQWVQASAPKGAFYQLWLDDKALAGLASFNASQVQINKVTITQAGQYTVKVRVCSDEKGEWCRFSNTQTFDVMAEDTSAYRVEGQAIVSGLEGDVCLTVNGQQASIAACDQSRNQAFLFGGKTLHWAEDTRLCLGTSAQSQGEAVKLVSCDSAPEWQYQNHQFLLGGLALDVNQSNQEVIVWGHHGGANQLWYLGAKPEQEESPNGFESEWTSVSVEPGSRYGEHTFNVPAAQNWVNTGLFLRQGQQATIRASGSWTVKNTSLYGPNGHASNTSRGCAEGELVARLGLYYKDPAIHCVGEQSTFTAHEDGILYVGAVVSNDLGETYEARNRAQGALSVTVSASGDTVPTLSPAEAAALDWSRVSSGWIEIRGDHTILTLPVATAQKDASKLEAAVKRIDDIYRQHEVLRGKRPYHGQPVRWFPDTKDAPGWMLAGNPVRMDPALVAANGGSRITLAAEPGNNDWGFAHELGHNFNFAGGDWYYTTFGGLEAWPNVFTLYAIDQLNLPPRDLGNCAQKKQEYLANNVHNDALGGAWTGLCFLNEFTERYGWEMWKTFYRDFNARGGYGWSFLRDRLNAASGDDTTDIFQSWNIPL